MALRWQIVGEMSHAVDTNHKPRPFERFRALCGRWCEVWPGDVQRRSHRRRWWGTAGWLDLPPRGRFPCEKCDRIWADMDGLSRAERRMDTAA